MTAPLRATAGRTTSPAAFLAAAALAVADGAARWLLIHDVPAGPPRKRPVALHRDQRVPLLVGLTALGAGALALLEPILPLHLTATLGTSPQTVGLLFGLAVLAASIVAPLAGVLADRLPPGALTATGTLVAAGAFALVGTARTLPPIALGLVLVTVAGQVVLAPTLALVARLAETRTPPAYGAAYALYTLAYAAGLAAAPLVAGVTAGFAGFRGATLTAAGFSTVIGLAASGFAAAWTARTATTTATATATTTATGPTEPTATDGRHDPAPGRP